MATTDYTVRVECDRIPSMQWLVDVIADALERQLHVNEADYGIEVKGPPELSIVVRER
jgi:hypothetical protein